MRFSKMQGIGNDYIYIDCTKEMLADPSAVSVKLSDRHFGVGSDGIILICPSEIADFRMAMFNADGSEAMMCGNGIRCFARFVHDKGLTDKTELDVETRSGVKHIVLNVEDGVVRSVRVNMGAPVFACAQIPVASDAAELVASPLTVDGAEYRITCVSMGNPHCVSFIDCDPYEFPLEKVGPMFENHALFPDRVNAEFVRRLPDGTLQMRVWERGSGETWACGTGACAVLAAAVRCGVIDGRGSVIHLRGGDLLVEWNEDGNIYMTGPAEFVYEGEVEL